ncbi:MAG: hypothetical protein L0J45_00515 [Psychroflexus sp.]|nr:hypothetical protein [Psychroflexus sp.]MDN6309961.1 hypothetical protein [Psychroflexus sp.]
MKKITILFLILFSIGANAQDFDDSKTTIIVPMKFHFMSRNNQYKLNILTRVLLKEAGFNVYMDVEDKPLQLQSNPCSSLRFELDEIDSFLRKRLQFKLFDCSNAAVYTSEVGQSQTKDYEEAYREALRAAFMGFSSKDLGGQRDFQFVENAEVSSSSSEKESDHKFVEKMVFKFAGQTYWMVQNEDNHYTIYTASTQNKFADLEPADKGSYIYKSGDLIGAAYFTPEGDLKVEYRSDGIDEVQRLHFVKAKL